MPRSMRRPLVGSGTGPLEVNDLKLALVPANVGIVAGAVSGGSAVVS